MGFRLLSLLFRLFASLCVLVRYYALRYCLFVFVIHFVYWSSPLFTSVITFIAFFFCFHLFHVRFVFLYTFFLFFFCVCLTGSHYWKGNFSKRRALIHFLCFYLFPFFFLFDFYFPYSFLFFFF